MEPHWPGIKPRLVRLWALLFWLAPAEWEKMQQAFLDQLGPFYLVWPRRHEVLWKREQVAHAGCLINETRLDAATGLRAGTRVNWMPVVS